MTPPLWVWVPSIAPSGMHFYQGELFKEWQGDLLVGALRGQALLRLRLAGDKIISEERLLTSGVTVDTTTGRVTISPAPTHPADVITAGFEFDIPVRFDADLSIGQSGPDTRVLESVELVELLAP